MVIGILIKFQEHSPFKYSLIRNSSSLVPKTIVRQSEESCVKFRILADKLYSLDKITAQVAGNAKNQFDIFIQAASFEHKESFLKCNFTEDCLDTFLGLYLANNSQLKDLCHIHKIIYCPTARIVENEGFLSIKRFNKIISKKYFRFRKDWCMIHCKEIIPNLRKLSLKIT